MKHIIIMPDLGQTTGEAKVLRWLKGPGDQISQGEVLLVVETDKANVDVEAHANGFLREILVKEEEVAEAGHPVAISTDRPDEMYDGVGRQEVSQKDKATVAVMPVLKPEERKIKATPAARSLARQLNLDLSQVPPTGPREMVTREDVERFHSEQSNGSEELVGRAAARLAVQSKQTIPHFYVSIDVSLERAEKWRKEWNQKVNGPSLHITLNDLFVRSAAKALRAVPELNVSYSEGQYEWRSTADILLIVAGKQGLQLVPLQEPDRFPWDEYLVFSRKRIAGAKVGRISQTHLNGSPLLAVSNLGMFGVREFTAIIPPSCTAALAIGAAREVPVVRDGQIVLERVCTLTLSADHRVVDGIIAAQFLKQMQNYLNSL